MGFHFYEKSHSYWLDGKRLFSVTERLAGMGLIETGWYNITGRVRGKAVHLACTFIESEELDWESLKETERVLSVPIGGYVRAWEKFLKESGWKSTQIEVPMVHQSYLFAGTPDRVGFWPDGTEGVLDLKSGGPLPWHALQLGAYDVLAPRINPNAPRKLATIHLHENGNYSVEYIKSLNAGNLFLAANSLHAWGIQTGTIVDHRETIPTEPIDEKGE